MIATLTGKGQITLPKEIRDRLGLDAGSMLDFQILADLFGGQLQGSATPRIAASMLGNRSLTLPKGTAFTCALKTKVISATSGLVGCQVQRNVFSASRKARHRLPYEDRM